MQTITVGMDESEAAVVALRWALAEREVRGDRVVALLAWGPHSQHHPHQPAYHDPEYDDIDATLALETFVSEAVGPDSFGKVDIEVVCEPARVALARASVDSSLLVVGSHGYGVVEGAIMGSVSRHLLRDSCCPLVVVRPSVPRTVVTSKIVVGVDGSAASARALTWAVEEAALRRAPLEVVSEWWSRVASVYAPMVAWDPTADQRYAEQVVHGMLERHDLSRLVGPPTVVVTGGGSAAGLLIERAADAQLLVVGSRGIGGFTGMFVGSVAHHLAHHAPCPLVVVPPQGMSAPARRG